MNNVEYITYKKERPIQHAVINVTNECNLRCRYCFTQHNPRQMSYETAFQALNWLLEHKNPNKPLSISWFGGEPLLRFKEVIEPIMIYCDENKLPVKFGITTNCTLLTPKILNFFEHFNVPIMCSIDGPEDVQNYNRPLRIGKPSWPLVESKLDYIENYSGYTILRSTITPDNVNRIYDSYLLAKQYHFNHFFCGLDFTDPRWNEEHFKILEKQLFDIYFEQYDDITNDRYVIDFPLIESGLKDIIVKETNNLYNINHCGLGFPAIGITVDGNIVGCQEHSTFLKKDNFFIGDIWNGIDEQKHMTLLNQYQQDLEKSITEECTNCWHKPTCKKDNCPSLSYHFFQTFGKFPPAYCRLHETVAQLSLLFIKLAELEDNQKVINYFRKEK